MSCKSGIYTAATSAATINLTAAQPTSSIPLGTTVRRFGGNIKLSGNGILLDGNGYYDIDASVTLTAPAAGVYTVSLFADGTQIQGATQSITAAAADLVAFNIPALVRLQCCNATTLTLRISTTATLPATVTVNNVGVVVEKI